MSDMTFWQAAAMWSVVYVAWLTTVYATVTVARHAWKGGRS